MIILADYWMGRDEQFPDDLTDEIRSNAEDLLARVNLVLSWAYRDGVRPALDARTGTHVASGWRPKAINDATSNAATTSTHIDGNGIDLRDNGTRDLAQWCITHRAELEDVGLYMERAQWTPTWVHLQRVPPGSKRRYYIPSRKPPLVAALPGEEAVA